VSSLRADFIKWPNSKETKMLSNDFEFPFTFGAVDGSHIHIKAPLANLTDYTNRKSFTSVVLQAVCDGRMQFLDISTGWPGSMHDARIFRLSSLSTSLRTSSSMSSMFHILGDSAYALTNHVIVPFKDNGHLTPDEVHFNILHSSSRTIIKRSFARLKGKFRRLKYLDMVNMSHITAVITAACVLHNFIIMSESGENGDISADDSDENTDGSMCSDETPREKRQRLLQMVKDM